VAQSRAHAGIGAGREQAGETMAMVDGGQAAGAGGAAGPGQEGGHRFGIGRQRALATFGAEAEPARPVGGVEAQGFGRQTGATLAERRRGSGVGELGSVQVVRHACGRLPPCWRRHFEPRSRH
jgi:hypothetical protein